jgi:hypothetical protein
MLWAWEGAWLVSTSNKAVALFAAQAEGIGLQLRVAPQIVRVRNDLGAIGRHEDDADGRHLHKLQRLAQRSKTPPLRVLLRLILAATRITQTYMHPKVEAGIWIPTSTR